MNLNDDIIGEIAVAASSMGCCCTTLVAGAPLDIFTFIEESTFVIIVGLTPLRVIVTKNDKIISFWNIDFERMFGVV